MESKKKERRSGRGMRRRADDSGTERVEEARCPKGQQKLDIGRKNVKQSRAIAPKN